MNSVAITCAATLAPLLSMLGGCQNQTNTLTHAGDDPTPDLKSPMPSTAAAKPSPASLRGLDRRNWETQQVDAPRGQVQVQPNYSEPLVLNGTASRDGYLFPNAHDSLYLSSSVGAAAMEGAAQVVWPGILIVISPVRMAVGEPPWLTVEQPLMAVGVLPPSQTREDPALWKWVTVQPDTTAPTKPSTTMNAIGGAAPAKSPEPKKP
ncbi:MAG: hypothetical protein K8R92_03795 [Planctomycetes bacterium]|nr:hypothetical protein [Planctomycetota bacterium]